MTTAPRRKAVNAAPETTQDGPAAPTPPGDTGADVLGAETVTQRVGRTPELTPETEAERVARLVDEAVGRLPRGPFGLLSAEREDYPLTVHEAIAEVTRRVQPIAKDRRSSGPGENYNFRGIDDVLEALHPILGDVGLVILPGRVTEHRRESRPTRSGGTLNVALVRVRYTFVGPDGSRLHAEAWGEAGDSGDKATQKAHSQSYKTLCFQAFSIPTRQSAEEEPDATNEPARAWTGDELERATRARDAAHDAATLEALAAARRRAEHLLSVPVQEPFGEAVMPLSLYFDRRLAELTSATQTGGE